MTFPPIDDITVDGITYTHDDWEANATGTFSDIANGFANVIASKDLVGVLNKAISGTTTTLTADDSSNLAFSFTGSLGASNAITIDSAFRGMGFVLNKTTGGFANVIGYATGATVSIPAGGRAFIYGDGTDIVLASNLVAQSGGISVGGTLATTGNVTVGAALSVTTTASITGNASVGGTLTSTGAATVGGAMSVTGAITAASTAHFTGAVTVGGAQTLTGNLTAAADATFAGDVTISGGNLRIAAASGEARQAFSATNGNAAWMEFDTGSGQRWLIGKSGDLESTGNEGSDLEFVALADDGTTVLWIPLTCTRKDGHLILDLDALPTSASGLASGTIWSNSGVLTVVI